jgi:DNA-binding MarR family transcriptional regulator/N-acetylglutamate synthase-like GNAT family acetyltransferase
MRPSDDRADAVRAFNRFYTRCIGALDDAHLGSVFSLGEMRILYELAHRERPTASEIGDALGLDRGYLSRTLRAFKKRGLVSTVRGDDKRTALLTLTPAGRRAFSPLERRARDAIVDMLGPLGSDQQTKLVASMEIIRAALGDPTLASSRAEPLVLRTHRPGDMGWIVHRHGVLYADEFGYDERFEALVAKVVAGFIENWDAARERCWVAERNGEIVGSIFVVAESKRIAKLRLLLVEPSARGLGIGRRLVEEVVRFAKQVGYKRVELWTQNELKAARKIYKAVGFEKTGEEEHALFGKPLKAETWALEL